MTINELERAVQAWLLRRVARDDLLAGRVRNFNVEGVQTTPDLLRSSDVAKWSAVEPVRVETEVSEHQAPEEVEGTLDHLVGGFFGDIGARMLEAAVPRAPPPPNLATAIAQGQRAITATIFPLDYPGAGRAVPASIPVFRSAAAPNEVVVVYDGAAAYRVKYDLTVKLHGPAVMKLWLAASLVRSPVDALRIARVALP
jgi:hypothetical protein